MIEIILFPMIDSMSLPLYSIYHAPTAAGSGLHATTLSILKTTLSLTSYHYSCFTGNRSAEVRYSRWHR